MTDPFNWLRLVRLILAALVMVLSVAAGIPLGTGPNQADPFAMVARLVEGAGDLAESARSENGDGAEVLGEIVDEPIGAVGQPGAVAPETPSGAGGAGGVLGGGESIGPDDGAIAPSPSVPATVAATQTPSRPPDGSDVPIATSTASPGQSSSPLPSPSPSPQASPTPTATPTVPPAVDAIRLDEPVLRFLPEIEAATAATGVPSSILAGIVRVESNGDPNLIASGAGIGLTGVSDAQLAIQGVAPQSWHDPAANLLAGGVELAALYGSAGSWDAALEAYFGVDCDATNVCPGEYRYAVQAWANYYAGAFDTPGGSGFASLPPTWTPPALAPYVGASPRPLPLPPGVAAPTPTHQPSEPPTPTALPTDTPDVLRDGIDPTTDPPTEGPPTPTETPTPTVAPTATPSPTAVP